MSANQHTHEEFTFASSEEYAEFTFYNELVRKHNDDDWSELQIALSASFQKLCAESLVQHLRQKPYFQRFGGKVLDVIMMPTGEPYMFYIGLQIKN